MIEPGYICYDGDPEKEDTCWERCGDGVNLGGNECDDANVWNGDGCDRLCRVETISTDLPALIHKAIPASFNLTIITAIASDCIEIITKMSEMRDCPDSALLITD